MFDVGRETSLIHVLRDDRVGLEAEALHAHYVLVLRGAVEYVSIR